MFVPIIRASWKVTLIIRIYTQFVFNLSEKMFFLGLGLLTLSAKAQDPIVWFGLMTQQYSFNWKYFFLSIDLIYKLIRIGNFIIQFYLLIFSNWNCK